MLLGVPQTYPSKPFNGSVVSGFLVPSTESNYTYTIPLKDEIEEVSKGNVVDVENFRTDDKEALLGRIYEKTEKHFTVAKHLIKNKPWDFFMLVDMGVDRIHYGFWSYIDPTHHKYEPGIHLKIQSEHNLTFKVEDQENQQKVIVGNNGIVRLTPTVSAPNFWTSLLYPGQKPLAKDGVVKERNSYRLQKNLIWIVQMARRLDSNNLCAIYSAWIWNERFI